MKKIMYMAVAAIAALSSCSSEEFTQSSNGNNGEVKVFTATIEGDATSRSTYDATNRKALWETTDIVSINGVKYKAQTGGAATTTFAKASGETADDATAPYYAFFADGANTGTGYYAETGTFTLPPAYNGTVDESGNPKFNMPMYAYSAESTELSFKNLCGVLAISVPSTAMASVSSIVVSSDQQMNGAFTVNNETYALTFATKDLTAGDKKVTLNFSSAVTISDSKTFYIPVPAGDHTLKITVNGVYDSKNTSAWMTKSSAVTIERSKKYSIEFSKKHSYTWDEYVDLGLTSTKKWATCNVGAKSPDDYGDYFAWGATEPYYASGYSEITPNTHWISDKTGGYIWANAPYQTNSSASSASATKWNKYLGSTESTMKADGTIDDDALKTTLDATDDAATANWGSNWKMPTSADFLELARGCYIEWTSDYQSTGVKGVIVYKVKDDADKGLLHTSFAWKEIGSSATSYSSSSKTATTGTYSVSDTHIFLPAAGCRYNPNLGDAGSNGTYWSSSFFTSSPSDAFYLCFSSGNVYPQSGNSRRSGQGVRPVCQ